MTDPAVLKDKIDKLKTALAQDPKSKVFVALSDAYRELGMVDDALEVALRGTWELPQYAEGFAAVGRVYSERKVFKKAEDAFYKALTLDQMCITAYKGLASLLRAKGDLQKASDVLTKAIMLDPGDESLQKMMESLSAPADSNQSASSARQPVVAQESAMAQKQDGMKPITTATIADIYIEQGLYDKALDVYRELLADNPQDPSVQQKISELQALMANAETVQTSSATAATTSVLQASETQSEPAAVATGGADSAVVIEKLNGWLAAIQSRRNRV